jgi:hypothetical protein
MDNIGKIYIIKDSGICLYEIDCTDIKQKGIDFTMTKDSQLVSGFFSAIFSYGDLILSETYSTNNMEFIAYRNRSYYIFRTPLFIVILEILWHAIFANQMQIEGLIKNIAAIYQDCITQKIFNPDSCQILRNETFEQKICEYIFSFQIR